MLRLFRVRWLLFVAALNLISCGEVSYIVKNEVVTLSPQWSIVGEHLNQIDRTIGILESSITSVKNELAQAARVNNEEQKEQAQQRVAVFVERYQGHTRKFKQTYQRLRKTYTKYRTEFNEWETNILSDNITDNQGATVTLKQFKRKYKDLFNDTSTTEIQLNQEILDYNTNIHQLAESMGVYTSYEITLK